MTISVDMGNPAVWAYAQDVGGKYTGSILGWANMWGNLGAAAAPLIYNAVLGEKPQLLQWNMMFGVCLLAFVLSGLCGFVLDATKSLVQKSPQAES
jgi:nitrate/nitrite transporter NarK